MKNVKGITLISLVITIVVLIILSSVGIYLTLGNNGILNKAKEAKNETLKQAATEKMNLKITNIQIETYGEEQRMPTLQEFADGLCEDNDIQYVELQSKKTGSLNKIEVGNASSVFTKLKEYPYEFEINSSLQLASIDGVDVTINNNQASSGINYSLEETKTNDTWMGKPIYTKTIYIPSLPNATTTSYPHNIENVENIWVNGSKSFLDWGNYREMFPAISSYSLKNQITIKVSNDAIDVYTFSVDRSSLSSYITIEYTKTTDSKN